MRPLVLELQGFSTFRELTVVDFIDVELLALVGPTGAGKSSVIDAITFALYGSVARYGERDIAPLVHQLSTEARVRFTFEVGGQRYAATRVVRRTKQGGATTKEARLERGDVVLAGDAGGLTDQVVRLLGLDVGRFNKTVVLPQGRFAEFLHDTPKARNDLLRELFGFGVYERVGRRARDLAARLTTEADAAERALGDVDVTPERRGGLVARRDHLAVARRTVTRLSESIAAADAERAELLAQVRELDSQLAALARVVVPDDVEALGERIASAETAAAAATAALEAARSRARAAVEAVATGPSASECRRGLDLLERRRALQVDAADATGHRDRADAARTGATAAADVWRATITDARRALDTARAERDVAERSLADAGDAVAVRALLAAHADLVEGEARLVELRAAAAEADAAAAAAAGRHREATGQVDRLVHLAPAAALAAGLVVGEPCPVCARTVDHLPTGHHADAGELAAARAAAAAAERVAGEAERARAAAQARVDELDERLSRRRAEVAAAPSRDELTAALERLVRLEDAVRGAHAAVAAAEAAVARLDDDPDHRAALDAEQRAAVELAAAEAVLARITDDLAAADAAAAGVPAEEQLRADLAVADALEAARVAALATVDTAERQVAQADASLAAARAAEQQARAAHQAARDTLAGLHPPAASASLVADWRELARWCADTGARLAPERDRLVGEGRLVAARRDELVAEVAATAEGLVDRPTAPAAEVRDQLGVAEGAAVAALEHFDRDAERVSAARARAAQQRADAHVAKLLGDLLKTSGFQQWLLEEAMADLVARATVRLHDLTDGQYSLVADAGSFRVVDHRNADEIRDARSLSGGETFLTSLALALALADSSIDLAAEGAAPMESIFLDEGFGTLDPDTLDVVAGTIEELGASGRMVGIVTHIRELAERMPTRFEVAKGPGGSTVTRVDQ